MKKIIQEIQKENRKFILKAIHGCCYSETIELQSEETQREINKILTII